MSMAPTTGMGSGLGSGIGQIIGAQIGSEDITQGENTVTSNTNAVQGMQQPFINFGQSFLPTASNAIGGASAFANSTQGYNQFMSSYTNTPAAQYQLQQADEAQNNSAAARGGLLSGSNERALGTINNGIVAQNANNAYNEYLSGNQQQFGQLESALGNMFQAIGVGQTSLGQDVSTTNAENADVTALAQAQAKQGNAKGSGLGSIFSGLGSLPF
jgi:hypothetical protein